MIRDSFPSYDIGEYFYIETQDLLLGQGNFGCVYKGQSRKSKDNVAIKKIENKSVKQEELTILKNIESDYVVKLMATFTQDSFTYLVLELCDCDLSLFLKEVGKLSHQNLDTLISYLIKGYKVLHELEIIHRDIKPQNILINFEPVVNGSVDQRKIKIAKFTDFGISREVKKGSGVQLYNLAGTPSYMAPEIGANILENQEYNALVDMWSLGVLIFRCATGEEPFDEMALCKLFLWASNKNYDGYTAPKLQKDAPEKVKLLIKGLLEINTKKRLNPEFLYEFVIHGGLLHWNIDGFPYFADEKTEYNQNFIAKHFSFARAYLKQKEYLIADTICLACSYCIFPNMIGGYGHLLGVVIHA